MMTKFRFVVLVFCLSFALLTACRNATPNSAAQSSTAVAPEQTSALLLEAQGFGDHLPAKPYDRARHLELKGFVVVAFEDATLCTKSIELFALPAAGEMNTFLGKAKEAGFEYTLINYREVGLKDVTVFQLSRGSDVLLGAWESLWGRGDFILCET